MRLITETLHFYANNITDIFIQMNFYRLPNEHFDILKDVCG